MQETLLLEPMFEVPGAGISEVHITEECVCGKSHPTYVKTSPEVSEEDEINATIRLKQ